MKTKINYKPGIVFLFYSTFVFNSFAKNPIKYNAFITGSINTNGEGFVVGNNINYPTDYFKLTSDTVITNITFPKLLNSGNSREFTEIKVYPNPFGGKVIVEINPATETQVQVEVLKPFVKQEKFVATKQLLICGLHKLSLNGWNENYQPD